MMRPAGLALAALLAGSSRAGAQELRLYCKTDTLAAISHVGAGTPWTGGVSGDIGNMDYVLRPLTPADRFPAPGTQR